jgi:hypothetical protein
MNTVTIPQAATLPSERETESAAMIGMIAQAARDGSADVDKLERLILMKERIENKRDEALFNSAMASAQAEMSTVALDSANRQTSSRYASYAALDKAIRPIYSRHGLALTFDTGDGAPENYVRVVCDVLCGGFSRRYHIDMPADGIGAKGGMVMTRTHATGSAITYGQRYLLKLIFNVSTGDVDDDGNAAGARREPPHDPQTGEVLQHNALTGSLRASYILECRDYIRKATDGAKLAEWWKSPQSATARKDFELSSDEIKPLRDFVVERCKALGMS